MSSTVVIVALVVSALGSIILYNRYANWQRLPWYVTVTVLLVWMTGFSMIALLPFDVVDVFEPGSDATSFHFELVSVYQGLYWSSFAASWAAVPLLQGWVESGSFEWRQKLKDSLKDNLKFYAIIGGVSAVLLIYVAALGVFKEVTLASFLVALGNTWGLFLIILFLGHALVDLPRTAFLHSNPHLNKKYTFFQLARIDELVDEAGDDLRVVASDLDKACRSIGYTHTLRPTLEALVENVNANLVSIGKDPIRPVAPSGNTLSSMHELEQLNKRQAHAAASFERSRELFNVEVTSAISIHNRVALIEGGPSRASANFSGPHSLAPLVFYWSKFGSRGFWWMATLVLGSFSVMVTWSEIALPFTAKIGILRPLMDAFSHSPVGLLVVSTAWLLFLSIAVLSSLFKLDFPGFYKIVPHKHSDSASLLFSCLMLSRLAPALCYHFLAMARLESTSAFSEVMGAMRDVPLVGTSLQAWFPLVIVILLLANAFDVFATILSSCGLARFKFTNVMDDGSESVNLVSRGESLLRKEMAKGRGGVERQPLVPEQDVSLARGRHKIRSRDQEYSTDHRGDLEGGLDPADDSSSPPPTVEITLNTGGRFGKGNRRSKPVSSAFDPNAMPDTPTPTASAAGNAGIRPGGRGYATFDGF